VSAQPSVTLPPELDRVLRDYESAWGKRDAAALAKLFSEDGFVMASGHTPVRGRAAIETHYTGAGGALRLRAIAFATGENVGYILGGYRYADSPRQDDEGKFTLTLKKDSSSRWLIFSDMDNSNRRPPPSPPAPPPPPRP
jgi:ketosteroid isomerase-like protein